jgi:SpoIID/LytB domain protein
MHWSRRVRMTAAAGALAVGLTLVPGPAAPGAVAAAPPETFTIHGAGWGHGIGMSQYGAHGMGIRGSAASRILAFYYGGARAGSVALPSTIRVGMLQANRDPAAGGRLRRVLVSGVPVPGIGGSGRIRVSGTAPSGRIVRRSLAGQATWSIRPESGGMSVFDLARRRVFGPTRAGTGVIVRYQTLSPPALLRLHQTGQQLRWGRLDVSLVRDDRGVLRPRAVAVIPINLYLRGLAEMPGTFAYAALRAQAIAARSYALVAVQNRGQRWGRGSWTGCDCAVYSSVRDQAYAGYAKEVGFAGRRWVTAVRRTGRWVVRWGARTVQAFYSSSSGGYTSSNAQWGSAPLPYFPARRDPYDRGGGAHPNPNTSWTVTVSAASLGRRVGMGRAISVREVKPRSWGYRVSTIAVTGVSAGRLRTVTMTGAEFRTALGLKSTKFHVHP